jgi:hypothetical protein
VSDPIRGAVKDISISPPTVLPFRLFDIAVIVGGPIWRITPKQEALAEDADDVQTRGIITSQT